MTDMEFIDQMRKDKRFRPIGGTHERHWEMIMKDGAVRFFIYFKHALGGWNILVNGEPTQVQSIEDVDSFLIDNQLL